MRKSMKMMEIMKTVMVVVMMMRMRQRRRMEMNGGGSLMAKDCVVVSTFSGGSHVGTRGPRLTFPLPGRGRRTFHDGEEL